MKAKDVEDGDGLDDAVRRGDSQALASAFAAYRERLRRMVDFRIDDRLRGRVSTSDVLQDAYLEASKRLRHFRDDPDVPLFIWLRSVTMQRLVDVHRQQILNKARDAGREVRLQPGGPEASTAKMAELMGDLTSPSRAADRVEAIAKVRDALDRLSANDREVLALRHFEELSNRELAALLGIEPAAASKRYIRAIERLRALLESQDGLDGMNL